MKKKAILGCFLAMLLTYCQKDEEKRSSSSANQPCQSNPNSNYTSSNNTGNNNFGNPGSTTGTNTSTTTTAQDGSQNSQGGFGLQTSSDPDFSDITPILEQYLDDCSSTLDCSDHSEVSAQIATITPALRSSTISDEQLLLVLQWKALGMPEGASSSTPTTTIPTTPVNGVGNSTNSNQSSGFGQSSNSTPCN